MRQYHRQIQEERPLAVPPQEIKRKFARDVRSEFTLQYFALAVADEDGIPVAAFDVLVEGDRLFVGLAGDDVVEPPTGARFKARKIDTARPDELFLKAVLRQNVRLIVEVVDLPLAGDAGGIARIAEQAREDDFALGIEAAAAVERRVVMEPKAGAMRISPRQQNDPAGPANGRRVAVFDSHAGAGELVNVGCAAFLAAVAAKPLLPDVVEKDEDDIGPLIGLADGEMWQ